MKKIFIIIFFLLASQATFSQDLEEDSKPGYLITNYSNYNDTIWGNIQLLDKNKIKLFNENNNWGGRVYKANNTKGFYYDSTYYESLNWNGAYYFFKPVVRGAISLYSVNYKHKKTEFTLVSPRNNGEYIGFTKIEMFDEFFIVDDSSVSLLSAKEKNFRIFIMNYMKACPVLVDKIDKEELTYFNDLKQIIEEYNRCRH